MVDVSRLKFLESHEWVRLEDKMATVGVSDFAQKEISDIVYVELPKVGQSVKQKDSCMVIESVKAAFDIYAPLSGKVTEINARVNREPQIVNQSPYEEGWLYKLEITDSSELENLMDYSTYDTKKSASH